jgi:hypothetical protein
MGTVPIADLEKHEVITQLQSLIRNFHRPGKQSGFILLTATGDHYSMGALRAVLVPKGVEKVIDRAVTGLNLVALVFPLFICMVLVLRLMLLELGLVGAN